MRLTVLTPEKTVFEGDDVESLTIQTPEGEITLLPGHMPLVGLLKPGEMVIRTHDTHTPFALAGGMFRVDRENITLLADTAERIDEIVEQQAEEARVRAQQLLSEERLDKEEVAVLTAKLERDLSRLRLVRKHNRSRHTQRI